MARRVIKYTTWAGEYETDVGTAAANALSGADYDRGMVEAVESTATSNSTALGYLIGELIDAGAITEDAARRVLGLRP